MILLITFSICSFVTVAGAADIVLYVSAEGDDSWAGDSISTPFATIQKARDTIRLMKTSGELTGPVTVYIRGGLYELDEPIVFTPEDSGTKDYPVTYAAYKNEEPVISGGRQITGSWEDYEGKIKVCTIPAAKEGEWNFRQLFLQDQRQQRARIPNKGGFYRVAGGLDDMESVKYEPGHLKQWKNLNDVEVVISYAWNEARLPIAELNEEETVVTFAGTLGRRVGMDGKNRYYVDNVLEGLDEEGEWYLDRHTGQLFYWPAEESKLSELRAPVLNELLRFDGDVEGKNYIEYINIRGLTFCETDYLFPKEGIPPIRDVGDIWFPSAVTLKGVSNCAFEDNTIRNVATYGLDLTGDGNRIYGNTIYDTGSGGIVTRSYGRQRNVISYNDIHHCGAVFLSGVGINIDDGGGLIANNLIHHTSHSGIYARHFETDYGQEFQRKNQEQGLVIEYNEIYDVMHGANDGAGIFVRDDYIVIRNNLIHDVSPFPAGLGSPAWGIYLGCETRNCLVENNVVYRARAGQILWHNNINNTIFNNIFIDGGRAQYNFSNSGENNRHEKIRLLRNIFYFSNPDSVLYRISGNSVPMESDYNLIFHTKGKDMVITGLPGVDTFEEWQARGLDTHSIVADPLFTDPENDDYSLKPDSPAFKLGFKPIDLSRVGLRGKAKE